MKFESQRKITATFREPVPKQVAIKVKSAKRGNFSFTQKLVGACLSESKED